MDSRVKEVDFRVDEVVFRVDEPPRLHPPSRSLAANLYGNVDWNLNINLGGSSYRWNVFYAKSALNTSDLNLKEDVVDVNKTEKRVAKRIMK